MEESPLDNRLKLAYSELAMGNYSEAERFFKSVIEHENSALAWLGLGNTRLAYVNKNHLNEYDSVDQLINNAFYCYREARNASPEHAEQFESKVIDASIFHLTKFDTEVRNMYDQMKSTEKSNNGMLIASLLIGQQARSNMAPHLLQSLNNVKSLETCIACTVNTMAVLRDKTIAHIEHAIDKRNEFIKMVFDREHELGWYITDEKEKKRLLKEQQARESASKQIPLKNQSSKNINAFGRALIIIAFIVVIYFIIIQLQELYNR